MENIGERPLLVAHIEKNSYTVAGDRSWKNYKYSAKVRSLEEDDADKIIFFYLNEENSAYEVNLRSRYTTIRWQ